MLQVGILLLTGPVKIRKKKRAMNVPHYHREMKEVLWLLETETFERRG